MTVVISGGSSGFGLELAKAYAAQGWTVIDVSRSGKASENCLHWDLDLADPTQPKAVAQAILAAGYLPDLLILNAGYGVGGPFQDTPEEAIERQFQVNVLGNLKLCRAFLPAMAERKTGRIILMSSIAAIIPLPFQALYSATKAALLAFGKALEGEVRPLGLQVMVVLPGDMKSGFTAKRQSFLAQDSLYRDRYEACLAKIEKDEQGGLPAEALARAIVRQSCKKRMPLSMTCGWLYHLARFLIRILPETLAAHVIRKMYA